MDLTQDEFIEMLGCSKSTLYLYLCRPEFSNIVRKKREDLRGNNMYYANVTEKNIKRFRELMKRKRGIYYV